MFTKYRLRLAISDRAGVIRAILAFLAVFIPSRAAAEEKKPLPGAFRLSMSSEVRSTYVSLGKIVEDRPMHVMDFRAGFETEKSGVFGVRNWDVSSLSGRNALGVSSVSVRLELGWVIRPWVTVFAFVEQYDVVGGDARATNSAGTYRCAHNDWTLGGIGVRMRF